MDNYGTREFELLQRIGFVRCGGTAEERKAAEILMEELKTLGVSGMLEAFKIPCCEIKTARFEVLEPFYREYTVSGYGLSGSTPKEGREASFAYVEQAEPLNLRDVKGKICLVNERLTPLMYERLIKAGAVGFLTYCGTVVDDEARTDIEVRWLRETFYRHGKLPGLTLRAKDALELVKSGASKVRMTLLEEEGECDSHNLLTEITGADYPEEIVAFCAHYDSTPFSNGVYDNGGGTVILMELLRHYLKNPPKRTVRFIWFGSEERGLFGSKHYVSAHKEELDKFQLLINVDMAGPVIGNDRGIITADLSLKNMVDYLSAEVGHPIATSQEVYSSDSTPFADMGVPAISFARFGAAGTAPGHNRYDLIEHLSPECFEKTTGFIALFADRLVNSVLFPVPREMPENMVTAIDGYLRKWDKKK